MQTFESRSYEATNPPLPAIGLEPASVWMFLMIDLAGHVNMKCFLHQRAVTRKSWFVLVTCLVSRAVLWYLAEDFSTGSLLAILDKHEARNGILRYITQILVVR